MQRRNLFYISLGTILEHLDNIIFGLYAPILGAYFFFTSSQTESWLLGLLAFSLYFLVRPLGAFLFGYIGDNFGRKNAFFLSLSLMAIATFGLGCAPSYKALGFTATFIFLLLRILQGISVGGEYGTAMTYIFESAPTNRQTFYGSLLVASTHVGGMLAACIAYIYPQNFQTVFKFLGIMGFLLVLLRLFLFDPSKPLNNHAKNSQRLVYKKAGSYLRISTLSLSLVFIFYTTTIYFNKIILEQYGLSQKNIYLINLYLLTFWVIATPLVGYLGDKKQISMTKIMRLGSSIAMFFGLPFLFIVLYSKNLIFFLIAQSILTISHIFYCAPSPKWICSFFEPNSRNTHVSLSYALGSSAGALLIPLLNNFSYQKFGFIGIIANLLVFVILGYLATLSSRQQYA